MIELCLFCNQFEEQHPKNVHYVCSGCTQELLNKSQSQLRSMMEGKGERALTAIKMFYTK